jgi:uncharacterized protein YqgV (UPF0045/DUF77 family)
MLEVRKNNNKYIGSAKPATGGTIPSSDTIPATNLTGSNIAIGDKVFLKENVAVSSSVLPIGTATNNTITNVLDTTGQYIGLMQTTSISTSSTNYGNLYDSSGNNLGILTSSLYISNQTYRYNYLPWRQFILYEGDKIFCGNRYFSGGGIITAPCWRYAQDFYGIDEINVDISVSPVRYTFNLYKYDEDFNVIKTWAVENTVTGMNTSLVYEFKTFFRVLVIGNKLYVHTAYGATVPVTYIGTIDNNADSITLTYFAGDINNKQPFQSTADNKIALCGYTTTLPSVKFFLSRINDSFEITDAFVSSNELLNTMIGIANVSINFNRGTGILCMVNTANPNQYGLFKYNPETVDFDTVSLTLPDMISPIKTEGVNMFVSNDMSKLLIGNQLFTLEQTAGGYKAIPYSNNIGSDVLTGYATSAAAHGQVFNARTVMEI